jgi:uncharacterized protein with PIN domain
LIDQAQEEGRVLLTSDTGIFRFGLVRDGEVPALAVPHGLGKTEQLAFVLGRLRLSVRGPRCMACGGELAEVPREAVRERAPPRTFARVEEFFECRRCRRLFWHGTHWDHVTRVLGRIERGGYPLVPFERGGPATTVPGPPGA